MAYRFSRKAAEDLENLYLYGAATFGVARAELYVAGLVEALEFLSHFPMAARARPELGPATRGHPYRSHIIFYRPDGANIFIQRIRHGGEDWQTIDA
ncbi:type II toxin-antitoxin system RelE/ParE family toxin [Phenylobacterium sp.]|uniref:type II toxin-antitoxin system RelE/ParE family toxin n=1 Tax=Phenylobacterium sp. TaxID=1871053 RepID=UPI002731274E|nr:type II toxin-antitoxin system RelE/ParE family toxin [Phenylobacterium sp.]MDP2214915.1 type II toxin-antitoxin system RelE/ParE family toxin [Phenylobacterium sp.]